MEIKAKNAMDKMDLLRALAELAPGCSCDWPLEGESGVIYSLACELRERFKIPHTAAHRNDGRRIPEDDL